MIEAYHFDPLRQSKLLGLPILRSLASDYSLHFVLVDDGLCLHLHSRHQ